MIPQRWFILSYVIVVATSLQLEQQQNMKSVVGSLLEIDVHAEPEGRHLPLRIHSYMKDLYTEAVMSGIAGTVRTVSPVIDIWQGKEILVFPLSQLKIGDRLIRAELHILGSHPDRIARALNVEALLGNDLEKSHVSLKIVGISQAGVTWNAVKPILHNFANSTNLIIKLRRDDGKRMRPMTQFMNKHSPFLTIYTRSNEEEEILDRRSSRREKRSINSDSYFAYESEDSNVLEKAMNEYIEKGPSLLNTRVKNTKFTRRRYEKMRAKHPFWGFGEEYEKKNKDMKISERILKIGSENEQKEEMGERTLEMTTAVNDKLDDGVDVVLLHHEHDKHAICSRQPLRVDFSEIGWSDWVIAPLAFEAGFCGGECPFPLPKEARASNHALVQSALSSSSSGSGLPLVCCAPDRMDSLTLLYYDQQRNIVLKTFPRMIVSSCGCI